MNHRKGYVTAEAAARSKAAQVPGATLEENCRCGLVHVNVPAAPRAPRKRKPHKDTGASRAVRNAVFDRDRWCLRCGNAPLKGGGGYSIHHLWLRSHGVDNSVEAQVLFCGSGTTGCHGWVHAHPAAAMAAGWIRLGNASADLGEQPVMVALPSGYGWFALLPDGTRRGIDVPEGAAA